MVAARNERSVGMKKTKQEFGVFTCRDGEFLCKVVKRHKNGLIVINYICDGEVIKNAMISERDFEPDCSLEEFKKLENS